MSAFTNADWQIAWSALTGVVLVHLLVVLFLILIKGRDSIPNGFAIWTFAMTFLAIALSFTWFTGYAVEVK